MELADPALVLVRYGEIALKGGNRQDFEVQLARNLEYALRHVVSARVERQHSRLFVFPEGRVRDAAQRMQAVFGVKSVSPVWIAPLDMAAIGELGTLVLGEALARYPGNDRIPFRVQTTRQDKRFGESSVAIDRAIGEVILPRFGRLQVNLSEPKLELGIEIRRDNALVFAERFAGPGGLPVGSMGRGLCLLSGGLDSPVAAWMTMKRGLALGFVTFHSYPYIGDASKAKVVELARRLGRWQRKSRLYVAPFAPIQECIRDAAPPSYRTVLYRRAMNRVACALSARYGYAALVTGECLGQVASQTIENITCIADAATLPVLRPVIGFDKDETIAVARTIGTFDISDRNEPDCCTLFMPDRPVIRGDVEVCRRVEAEMSTLPDLVAAAVEGVEFHEIESDD